MKRKLRRVLWVGGAVVLTALAILVFANLMPDPRRVEMRLPYAHGTSDPQFLRTLDGLFEAPIAPAHRIDTLVNGDRIFPAMLGAIAAAERTVNFETYVYWEGEIARRFAQALIERARAGIEVRVLVDWVGSIPMDQDLIEEMRRAGVMFVRFRKPRWYTLDRMNNRTHRKLLIVDGRIGFTGGVGIDDKWLGDARNPDEWRENHYRIEGPAVAQMQAAFVENWIEATGEVLRGDGFFPPLPAAGEVAIQAFRSSHRTGGLDIHLMKLLALSSAERHIRIGTPYFVPDDLSIAQMIAARARGVEVDVIVPGPHSDYRVVQKASRHFWGELLEAGIRIWEYQPTMYHLKLLVVDEAFVSTGSANYDERSFRHNDESNINVYDAAFAREQIALFEADRAKSRPVTLEEWRNRPRGDRVREWFWSWFRVQF